MAGGVGSLAINSLNWIRCFQSHCVNATRTAAIYVEDQRFANRYVAGDGSLPRIQWGGTPVIWED